GNIYLTGSTTSTNFPTLSAYQTTLKGTKNAFVTQLLSGGALGYSTYLGGSGTDSGNALMVDGAGATVIAGTTSSTDFPVLSAMQSTYGGGASDAFLTSLIPSGSALNWSSYLGGSGTDVGYGVMERPNGVIGEAGAMGSNAFMDLVGQLILPAITSISP